MWNAECGIERKGRSPHDASLYIPHSALRTPHSGCLRVECSRSHAARDLLDVGGEWSIAVECRGHRPHGRVRTPHALPRLERFQEFEPLSGREQLHGDDAHRVAVNPLPPPRGYHPHRHDVLLVALGGTDWMLA